MSYSEGCADAPRVAMCAAGVVTCLLADLFGESLAEAVAPPAVELFQALHIIVVVDVRSTCLQPCAVLFDSLLPSSLGV